MKSLGKTYRQKTTGSSSRNVPILKILIVIISCLILWDVAGPFGLWAKHRMEKQQQELYTFNMQLAMENVEIEKNIKNLKENREYQARIIRKRLGWVKDNEILFRFMNEKQGQP